MIIRPKLDQLVVVEWAAAAPYDIKAVWAVPQGQIPNFEESVRQSFGFPVASPLTNINHIPYFFKNMLSAVNYGLWMVRGMRRILTLGSDSPWNPGLHAYDTMAELISAGTSYPVTFPSSPANVKFQIDGLPLVDIDLTPTAGRLVQEDAVGPGIVDYLNSLVAFNTLAEAFAAQVGDSRQLGIRSKNATGPGSVEIITPASNDVSALLGFTSGAGNLADFGDYPREISKFTQAIDSLVA